MCRIRGARSGGLLGAALVSIALALGWGAVSSVALPAPEELVPNTVALISDTSSRGGTITRHELRHEVVIVASQSNRRPLPRPGDRGYERLQRKALGNRLEVGWILGEAAERNISVTPQQVSRTLALIKKESFQNGAEYRRFLKEFHYTRRDVRERVEIQLLSAGLQEWLQRRISREASTEDEERPAIEAFIAEFSEKWKARTVCAPEYAIDRCSNGPPPTRHVRRAPLQRHRGLQAEATSPRSAWRQRSARAANQVRERRAAFVVFFRRCLFSAVSTTR
jgi:hypothetical protein